MVKPQKFELLKNKLLSMYQAGQLTNKVSESQLISMLEQFNQQKSETKIQFRRRTFSSSDEDGF